MTYEKWKITSSFVICKTNGSYLLVFGKRKQVTFEVSCE